MLLPFVSVEGDNVVQGPWRLWTTFIRQLILVQYHGFLLSYVGNLIIGKVEEAVLHCKKAVGAMVFYFHTFKKCFTERVSSAKTCQE